MSDKLNAWLQLFRLPNLPTAPGDALAGAALLMGLFPETFGGRWTAALAAGGASFFLYLFGLADNDLVGAADDAVHAPDRPIPREALSVTAVRLARAVCLLAAFGLAFGAGLRQFWALMAVALVACILSYNRTKNVLLMGCCRGLSLVAGGTAVMPDGLWRAPVVWQAGDPWMTFLVAEAVLVLAALGWTGYIAAVTLLSVGEARASEGLGNRRYVLGVAAFLPLVALVPAVAYRLQLPDPGLTPILLLLPLFGSLWTFATWCAAVAPLWQAHGPAERRAAVGRTIGALLYLQIGFMLVAPGRPFALLALALWCAARLIRRLAPAIRGS